MKPPHYPRKETHMLNVYRAWWLGETDLEKSEMRCSPGLPSSQMHRPLRPGADRVLSARGYPQCTMHKHTKLVYVSKIVKSPKLRVDAIMETVDGQRIRQEERIESNAYRGRSETSNLIPKPVFSLINHAGRSTKRIRYSSRCEAMNGIVTDLMRWASSETKHTQNLGVEKHVTQLVGRSETEK